MKRLLIYFLPLLFVSSCDGVPSQDFFTEKTVADSSAVSDSLLFLEYSERYNYHYGMRSDSVSWYLDELLKLSEKNNKQLEVIRLSTNKATGLMNSGNILLHWSIIHGPLKWLKTQKLKTATGLSELMPRLKKEGSRYSPFFTSTMAI